MEDENNLQQLQKSLDSERIALEKEKNKLGERISDQESVKNEEIIKFQEEKCKTEQELLKLKKEIDQSQTEVENERQALKEKYEHEFDRLKQFKKKLLSKKR